MQELHTIILFLKSRHIFSIQYYIMKQTVSISQNMGCNPTTTRIPNITFPAGNRRPTFDNQLIKKKEFKSINTVNSSGPDMSKTTVQIPLKDHVKASYSNGDLKKMTFIGKEDIVNTFYTPPIQIKHKIKVWRAYHLLIQLYYQD